MTYSAPLNAVEKAQYKQQRRRKLVADSGCGESSRVAAKTKKMAFKFTKQIANVARIGGGAGRCSSEEPGAFTRKAGA